MKHLAFLVTVIVLLNQTTARPSPTIPQSDSDDKTPKPTRLFTVAAFESPYPVGQGLTGITMRAQGGGFFLNPENSTASTECDGVNPCPLGKETVLFVDKHGKAWLDSANPQPIYLDTQNGPLSYVIHESASTILDGADFAGFVHLGYGTAVYTNGTGYISSPPGTFNWIGNLNEYWLACPRPGPGYQVLKSVSTAIDNLGCTTVQLAALDYSGKSPAAGAYI